MAYTQATPINWLSNNMLVQQLSTNGDGTGTVEAIGDYSVAAEEFYIEATRHCHLEQLTIKIEDVGSFDSGFYGNNVTLTNGIVVEKRNAADVVQFNLTPFPIMKTADWAAYCYDLTLFSWGAGNETAAARWQFSSFVKDGVQLSAGEKFVVRFNDDFSGLVRHEFLIEGNY